MTTTCDNVEQIRRAWRSAKPKDSNPAWKNSHMDIGRLLDFIDTMASDSARIDWLGGQQGVNLVSDDGGKWAVSGDGFQPVPEDGGFTETVSITTFVDPDEWRGDIREAIDAARLSMQQE